MLFSRIINLTIYVDLVETLINIELIIPNGPIAIYLFRAILGSLATRVRSCLALWVGLKNLPKNLESFVLPKDRRRQTFSPSIIVFYLQESQPLFSFTVKWQSSPELTVNTNNYKHTFFFLRFVKGLQSNGIAFYAVWLRSVVGLDRQAAF